MGEAFRRVADPWRPGRAARALAVAAVVAVSVGIAPPAAATVDPARGCGWSSKLSGATRNVLFIDTAAAYWTADVPVPHGAHLEIAGRFPHARYMSLVVYDERGRTVDHLVDVDIRPDDGSTNPFVAGAERTAVRRSFTLRVVNERAPAGARAANTLYMESADGTRSAGAGGRARLTLRVYTPDTGTDEAGGVPLPDITVVRPGGGRTSQPPCLDAAAEPAPATTTMTAADRSAPAADRGPAPAAGDAGDDGVEPPRWKRFLPDGLGENVDNAYVYAGFRPAAGTVLALRARAPSFPATRAGDPEMGTGEVRYWSMCTNDLATTAVLACTQDEDVPLGADGRYTIVVSRPAARPANAVPECGVAWLPAAPGEVTVLVYRHMLPDPAFDAAIHGVDPGDEERAMGDHYPRGTVHPSAADFEATGCTPPPSTAGSADVAAGPPSTDPGSARPSWWWVAAAAAALAPAVVVVGAAVVRSRRTSSRNQG